MRMFFSISLFSVVFTQTNRTFSRYNEQDKILQYACTPREHEFAWQGILSLSNQILVLQTAVVWFLMLPLFCYGEGKSVWIKFLDIVIVVTKPAHLNYLTEEEKMISNGTLSIFGLIQWIYLVLVLEFLGQTVAHYILSRLYSGWFQTLFVNEVDSELHIWILYSLL